MVQRSDFLLLVIFPPERSYPSLVPRFSSPPEAAVAPPLTVLGGGDGGGGGVCPKKEKKKKKKEKKRPVLSAFVGVGPLAA